jgi:UDP-N-acetylglucosamine 3-dehydrogenase
MTRRPMTLRLKALRLALFGRGPWGRNIERTLRAFPHISVTVVARGATPPRDLDGVVIATPGATHAELAIPYIEAGIATFIEKPMATTRADAERIVAAAERAGGTVFVGHVHLHNPAFRTLLDVLPTLGAIRSLTCEGMNDRPRADCSVLWDWLPHDLTMALAMFGRLPDRVSTVGLGGSPVTQAAVATFHFGGVPMVSTVSWLSPVRRQQMTIQTGNGTLIFDDKAERKLTLLQGGTISHHPTYDDELPLTREMRSFVEVIRSGTTDRSQAVLGAAVVRMIAAAEKSILLGGASVRIEDS